MPTWPPVTTNVVPATEKSPSWNVWDEVKILAALNDATLDRSAAVLCVVPSAKMMLEA